VLGACSRSDGRRGVTIPTRADGANARSSATRAHRPADSSSSADAIAGRAPCCSTAATRGRGHARRRRPVPLLYGPLPFGRRHALWQANPSALGRKRMGRPPGSKNKPKLPFVVLLESEATMRAVILEVSEGSDVVLPRCLHPRAAAAWVYPRNAAAARSPPLRCGRRPRHPPPRPAGPVAVLGVAGRVAGLMTAAVVGMVLTVALFGSGAPCAPLGRWGGRQRTRWSLPC
jgi:hypothetical protein